MTFGGWFFDLFSLLGSMGDATNGCRPISLLERQVGRCRNINLGHDIALSYVEHLKVEKCQIF